MTRNNDVTSTSGGMSYVLLSKICSCCLSFMTVVWRYKYSPSESSAHILFPKKNPQKTFWREGKDKNNASY